LQGFYHYIIGKRLGAVRKRRRLGKDIVPFMLRGFKFGDNLPDEIADLPLQNGVNANSSEYFDASVERLTVKFLKSKPADSAQSKGKKRWVTPAIVGAVTAAAVFVALIAMRNESENEDITPLYSDTAAVSQAVTSGTVADNDEDEVYEVNDYTGLVFNSTICADNFGVAAVKEDGTVYSYDMDVDLSGWNDIVSVSVGTSHVLGLKSDGTVVAMGDNFYRQCNVEGWSDVIAIHAGHSQSFGIKKDGTIFAAGELFDYNLGVLDLRDVVMVCTGMHHVAALLADGTVEVFGRDSRGEDKTSGWSDIVAIAAFDFYTVGIKSDGSVVWTGENEHGEISDWSGITAIAAGRDIVGVKDDGSVVVNESQRLNGLEVLDDWSDVVAVCMTFGNVVGLKSDGTVVYTRSMRFDDIDELDEWKDVLVR
jgi:hypothetical protein